jgi:phospholipase C
MRPARFRRSHTGMRASRTSLLVLVGALLVVVLPAARSVIAGTRVAAVPIQHVVILFQENHSFDDVFGLFCADVASGEITRSGVNMGCDGATSGKTATGKTIPLAPAPTTCRTSPTL